MPRFRHELLLQLRLDLGLGQEEAAQSLGIDARTYRRYESGAVNQGGDFSVRNASRRALLRRLCEEFGVAQESDWLAQDAAPAESPARGHALPRAARFVGRAESLLEVERFLAAPEERVLAVVGVGGSGKSALLERVLAEHPAGRGAWVHSFNEEPHTEPAVERLGRADAPGLVVLDGVESVQSDGSDGRAFGELEDPALRRCLRAVAAGHTAHKVLLTSRFALTDLAGWEGRGARTLALADLTLEETLALLRAWGLRGDEESLRELARGAGGHALSAAMLGSYASAFCDGDAALAASLARGPASDDGPLGQHLEAVLAAYASALAPEERSLLARLSLFAGPAEPRLLALLAGEEESALRRRCVRLERLGLLSRSSAGSVAHPLVRAHFKALLGAEEPSAHEALRGALARELAGRPRSEVRDEALLDRYEALLVHTRGAGHAAEALGLYHSALGGFAKLGLRLGAMTRGARVLSGFSEQGDPLRLHPALRGEARASALYDWGLYAGALGDLALAGRCHDAHLAALDALRPELRGARRAVGLRTRAYVDWLAGDLAAGRERVRASLALAREEQSAFHESRGLVLAAMLEHAAGEDAEARRSLARARELEPGPVARRALWESELCLAWGDDERALALAERALRDARAREWPGHVAHALVQGALCLVDARPEEAARRLEEAWPWVLASGEVEMALRCRHLALRVALARGRSEDAARERALGAGLAQTHGFGLLARLFEGPAGVHPRV